MQTTAHRGEFWFPQAAFGGSLDAHAHIGEYTLGPNISVNRQRRDRDAPARRRAVLSENNLRRSFPKDGETQ